MSISFYAEANLVRMATIFVLAYSGVCEAQLLEQLKSGFSSNSQVLVYTTVSDPTISDLNPGNTLAKFRRAEFDLSFRPRFKYQFRALSLTVEPRLVAEKGFWGSYSTWKTDVFFQTWTASIAVRPDLTLSYGREVMNWGPAMSASVSNPFLRDNGRGNPLRELGSRDYFRAVWAPTKSSSVSYIDNTALRRGDRNLRPFRSIHALKADYAGQMYSLTGLVSKQLGDRMTYSGNAQTSIGAAWLLYGEGSVRQGSTALYPTAIQDFPGWSMPESKLRSDRWVGTAVAGVSHTLLTGSTLYFEYIGNGQGYSRTELDQYYKLGRDLSPLYLAQNAGSAQAGAVLGSAIVPQLQLLGRRQVFFQFLHNNLAHRSDVILRYTASLSDSSGSASAYGTYSVNDRVQAFAVATYNNGPVQSEYARLFRYQMQFGLRIYLW